jgi:hypothetical protein
VRSREQVQKELDTLINAAVTPPGVWEVLFGGKPKPLPPPPPRLLVQVRQEVEEDFAEKKGMYLALHSHERSDAADENMTLAKELAGPIEGRADAGDGE